MQDAFVKRHVGPGAEEISEMLKFLGFDSLEKFTAATIPVAIRTKQPFLLGPGHTEYEVLNELRKIAAQNQIFRSYIGMGYSDCVTPPVIQRNILENPGWYTQYTPYQAEISQGRLEALLNFQTMIIDLTGLPIANASLLDEGTAAAEAMSMCLNVHKTGGGAFFVSDLCHPQTIQVVKTRAEALGIKVIVGDHRKFSFKDEVFGVLVQYPTTDGVLFDYSKFIQEAHKHEALVVMAADILSLAVVKSPGEIGADIAVGSTQRFGVPLGFGGPHAAYFSTKDEYKRLIPGRLVGVSIDAQGKQALRLALQTREQHIRREKATSNICTAQVLLAVVAAMYATYHGPKGIREIAGRVHRLAVAFGIGLERLGFKISSYDFFDTVRVELEKNNPSEILSEAQHRRINLRVLTDRVICVALDETTLPSDLMDLWRVFAAGKQIPFTVDEILNGQKEMIPFGLKRNSEYLSHPVFNSYHSETEMLRYMKRLESRDLSLTSSMIPLGSCTMKLNSTAEMLPITWPEFGKIHPFAPTDQTRGYRQLIDKLSAQLSDITGFAGISLQPNAGSQGEYAGLLVIRKYHQTRREEHRDICLIPQSAHGTNPASAVMAGLKVVIVECDENGNVSLQDLKAKAAEHGKNLAGLMITYPSTHGVFEETIEEICEIVHQCGGQVYLDGANMNAQVGLCRPAEYGADVCHLNLHKTFCIPHGGGGPGMGPIGVAKHLVEFLPTHPLARVGGETGIGAIASAPFSSASILPIPYAYIAMMGSEGLKHASEVAVLNANYIAKRLADHFPILFKGKSGMVAHECIIDLRPLKASSDVTVDDIAKRLIDYGFHAPTVSFPVAGTMMIEPTESESKLELDRFCDAMIAIRGEVAEIEKGKASRENNLLKNAPHAASVLLGEKWDKPYSRERAAFPTDATREHKFWPPVSRIDNPYGDRNLMCSCPPVESDSKPATRSAKKTASSAQSRRTLSQQTDPKA